MKEIVQSLSSFTLAMPFLGMQLAGEMIAPFFRGEPMKSRIETLDAVTDGTTAQLDSTLRATFHVVNDIQKVFTGTLFDLLWPAQAPRRQLNTAQVQIIVEHSPTSRVEYSESLLVSEEIAASGVRPPHSIDIYPVAIADGGSTLDVAAKTVTVIAPRRRKARVA